MKSVAQLMILYQCPYGKLIEGYMRTLYYFCNSYISLELLQDKKDKQYTQQEKKSGGDNEGDRNEREGGIGHHRKPLHGGRIFLQLQWRGRAIQWEMLDGSSSTSFIPLRSCFLPQDFITDLANIWQIIGQYSQFLELLKFFISLCLYISI